MSYRRTPATAVAVCTAAMLAVLPAPEAGAVTNGPMTQEASAGYGGAAPDAFADRPQISGDGRFVTFDSRASNLTATTVTEPDGKRDVYERDLLTGETRLVSATTDGTAAMRYSSFSWPSDDGRYVAFASSATNITATPTARQSIFVRDMSAGVTEVVSVNNAGKLANAGSSRSMLSGDGRYVVFNSTASNLTPTALYAGDQIYLRDRSLRTTQLISVGMGGKDPNGQSYRGSVSDDGRYVTFSSFASNLVPNDTNGKEDIFVRDLVLGTTTRVSVGADGSQSAGASTRGYMTPDGRYVVFSSYGALVPEDTNTKSDVYVYDTVTRSVTLASGGYGGASGSGDSLRGFISDDGRYVVFNSYSSNLTKNRDTNGKGDVYVRDMTTGVTTLASLSWYGGSANGTSYRPVPSSDGSVIVYQSNARNLVDGDASVDWQVYTVQLASLIPGGDQTRPTMTNTSPVAGSTSPSPVTFTGTAADNVAVDRVQLAIRDNATSKWLQPDGSWGSTQAWRPANLDARYATETGWNLQVSLPPGRYAYVTNVFDTAGNQLATKPWIGFTAS